MIERLIKNNNLKKKINLLINFFKIHCKNKINPFKYLLKIKKKARQLKKKRAGNERTYTLLAQCRT